MTYSTAVIRELLIAAFDDDTLTTLCYDYFRPVYETFATGMFKTQKVQSLIDHCQRTNQLPDLLHRVQVANSAQYARFEADLFVASQPLPPSSSDPLPVPFRSPRRPRGEGKNRNPFRYLRPVPPEEFLGRWPMVKAIAHDLTLDEGDSYACIGGRRFGKSSLLAALHHSLRQPEIQNGDHLVLPILIDFKEGFASEANFFAHVLYEVRRRVDPTARLVPDHVSPATIKLDQAWLDSFLIGNPPSISLTHFREAVNYILDQLYQVDGPTRVVLLLDEVDDVLSLPWHQTLFNQLRSLVYAGDLANSVRLVLSGSRRFLNEVSDRGSPLWNILKIHYLTVFDELATNELSARAQNLPAKVQEVIWQQSGGHAFLAQYLLHHLWEVGLEQTSEAKVAQLVNRFLHEEQAHLDGWAKALEEIGLQVYSHFVNQSNWIDEDDLLKAVEAEPNAVKRGLVALCYHGFITHDGSWSRYRRAGDLLRQWYLSRKPNQPREGDKLMALPPEVAAGAASFLFEIGRWAAAELKERWKLARQKKNAGKQEEVDISKPEEPAKQQIQSLLENLAIERGTAEVERVLGLIERKRDLIAEWREIKVDNEEEYNRQRIDRAALRLRQKEVDEKITKAMTEIETDLKELGIQIKKEPTEQSTPQS